MDLVRAITDQRERDIRERARVARILDAARSGPRGGRVGRSAGERLQGRVAGDHAARQRDDPLTGLGGLEDLEVGAEAEQSGGRLPWVGEAQPEAGPAVRVVDLDALGGGECLSSPM